MDLQENDRAGCLAEALIDPPYTPLEEETVHRGLWPLVAFTFFLTAGIHGEERSAIASIALVLSEFAHTCTPVQREALSAIVRDDATPNHERALAAALLRINHVPDTDDMSLLGALAHDLSSTSQVRTVARVLQQLVHVPSENDRALLASLVSEEHHQQP